MLPMKLDLTEELAATLRQLRLEHPVNGEVLTAENLSKAIGNNRAWMSQIESRRLKKIRREDIIKIYKLLFICENDQKAEDKAELDLLNFIIPDRKNKLLFGDAKKIQERKEEPDNRELTKKDLHKITEMVEFNCEEIANSLMEFYIDEADLNKKVILAHQIQQTMKTIMEGQTYSLELISQIPIALYRFADDSERVTIQAIIKNLNEELEKLQYKSTLDSFDERIRLIMHSLSNHMKTNSNDIKDSIVMGILELGEILYRFPNITTKQKIACMNNYIMVLNVYAQHNSMIFSLNELSETSTTNDFKVALNYMQSFVNGINGTSSYLLNHISDYYND